ncbi:MAG: ATP-binding protein [Panacagrimonas sp.]
MSLKHSFTLAIVMAMVVLGLNQFGWLPAADTVLPYALAAVVLVAAAGAWFVDLLDRRLAAMKQAVQKLAAGEDSLRLRNATRGMPEMLAGPFADMATAVNRRLAELQSVIAQQRAIAEHGPDAMWVFDVDTFQIIDANENFARLTGHPRHRLIGMSPTAIASPAQQGMATQAYVLSLVQRALAGEKLEVPWIVRRTDGTDVPCELRAIHLPAPGRTLICGLLLDISERHRTQSELDRRMRFESLITRLSTGFIRQPIEKADDAIDDALGEVGRFADVDRAYIIEFSASRERVSCTHEWCESGVEPQRAKRQNLAAAQYAWGISRIERGEIVAVDRVAEMPSDAAAERAVGESGSIRSILLVPMQDGSGVTGYIGFDSVRKEVQWSAQLTTLLKLFGEMVSNLLARKRSQLTLQVQNEDLGRSNTELERSNQELQQFAYIASHDLQEPLRAIGGFSGLLARRYRGKLDAQAEEYLGFLTEAATRMQRMIVDLLDYSRLGHNPRSFQTMQLRDALDAALSLLQASVQELHAEFDIAELPTLQGDSQQLTQLFQNLIGNALKFHGEAAPHIAISSERVGNEWIVAVRDNGIGIPPEQAAEVFQIFRRLHSQEQYPGTGIGLAVCKRIVERHRGRIWAEPNAEGPGSTFRFSLPASGDAAA